MMRRRRRSWREPRVTVSTLPSGSWLLRLPSAPPPPFPDPKVGSMDVPDTAESILFYQPQHTGL